jgi:hypothetical protein
MPHPRTSHRSFRRTAAATDADTCTAADFPMPPPTLATLTRPEPAQCPCGFRKYYEETTGESHVSYNPRTSPDHGIPRGRAGHPDQRDPHAAPHGQRTLGPRRRRRRRDRHEDTGPHPRIPVAPPPDTAITLRIACTRESSGVRVGAVGSGAIAWTAHQKTLLGAKWQRDERGAPFVLLEKTPTLFADLRAAHPDATIDNADCQDTDLLYSGRTSPETGARQAVGRAGRRGEKPEAAPPVAEVAADHPRKPPTRRRLHRRPRPSPTSPHRRPRSAPRKHDAVAAGPGDLEWVPITENTVEGFAAAWRGRRLQAPAPRRRHIRTHLRACASGAST